MAVDNRVTASEARGRIGTGYRGVVYVLCFDRPYEYTTRNGLARTAQHYIGWTRSAAMLKRRLAHHAAGTGARLLRAVAAAGIGWQIVAVFHNADRHFERYLHSRRAMQHDCPRCHAEARRPHRHIRRLRRVLRAALTEGRAVA